MTRQFEDRAIPEEHLWKILEAARWAPAASNIRLHKYMCVTDGELIRQIQLVSPGIVGTPPAALIAICVDRSLPAFDTVYKNYHEYIDAGTASENMLLAAHALDIGACPATLDSPGAVHTLLNLPEDWTIEMFVLLGYPDIAAEKSNTRRKLKLRIEDLVHWNAFPNG